MSNLDIESMGVALLGHGKRRLPSRTHDVNVTSRRVCDFGSVAGFEGRSRNEFSADAQRFRACADEVRGCLQIYSAGRNHRHLWQRGLESFNIFCPANRAA